MSKPAVHRYDLITAETGGSEQLFEVD